MTTDTARKISLIFGIVYVVVGVLGFIPGITAPSTQPGQGLLLGIFAVNAVHNIAHLLVGALLIWAGTAEPGLSANILRGLAVLFAVLVVASFVAPIAEGVAINVPDTLLHLVSTALTAYLASAIRKGLVTA